MSEEQKKLLEQQLWNIANTLRGKMDADEFRDYILGFIFYKYLSEKMHLYADKILEADEILYADIDEKSKQGKEYLEAIKEESLLKLGYFLKPSELFSEVAKRGNGDSKNEDSKSNFILEDLGHILRNIEASTMGTDSEDDFDNLFEDLDLDSTKLGRTVNDRNALISKVLAHLDKINFQLNDAKGDVLGDAYEYLIGQFASGAGKKAGEFYTPQQVSTVLARLVTAGKKKLKSVYDPTCGSGSLLLRVAREVKEVGEFYGQELNRTTYNLARMNMILHGVHYQKFSIRQEDTLEKPQHIDKRFEAIVANPPFSAQWSASPLHLTDDRFSQYGKLAPSSKADFAFIQHMIHHLAENGVMAVVAPHGVLFRGGAEGHIRRYLVEDRNYLDAVVGLPANIFYGTSIPTCVLVFKKCKEVPENILFIDASQGFEKAGNQNYLRDEHINKIINTYRQRIPEGKYSYLASLEEVKENDYNLNISRYVDTFEQENQVDLRSVTNHLDDIYNASLEIDKKLFFICEALDIPKPSGYNLSLLEQYKKGCMQQIFSLVIRFKDDNGKVYPDWDLKKMKEVKKIYDGTHMTPNYQDTGIPFYSVEHVTANDFSKTKFINREVFEKENKRVKLERGDILMTRIGDIGTSKYIDWDVEASFYVSLALIKHSSNLDNSYLDQYIKSHGFQHELHKRIIHVAFPKKINLGEIGECLIRIPVLEEQQKIANFLSAIDTKINLVNTQLQQTRQFKKGLLQQMYV